MGQVRPEVRLTSSLAAETIVRRVGRSLRASDCPVSGVAADDRIELHVHGDEQHMWSPQLIVEVHPLERGTQLLGRFGPHPSVWTMYMAGYATCGFGLLVGMSFAYAQWVMGQSMWALWSLPLCVLGAVCLYGLAFVGQRAGSEQMNKLQAFLEADLARHESIGPEAA